MLDRVGADRQLARWPQLHIARAELLGRLGRPADAVAAYQAALDLAPAAPERDFLTRRIRELTG
jgi:RNA polymerase sigma-70 factor (ECF subfamily)